MKTKSEEHKKKISESLKKAHKETQFGFKKENKELRFTGKKHSKETKKKQSDSKKTKNPMWNEETRKKASDTRKKLKIGIGEDNNNWKGGISTVNSLIRGSVKYKEWRTKVYERDNYTCQDCQKRSSKEEYIYLNAHHIIHFSENEELRFDVDNGKTLCRKCHKKYHKNGKNEKLNK